MGDARPTAVVRPDASTKTACEVERPFERPLFAGKATSGPALHG